MSDQMINVTLPDDSVLEMAHGSTIGEVAAQIGPGLAKAAIAGQVDGETVDLSYALGRSAAVRILTARDEEALVVLRHSAPNGRCTACLGRSAGSGARCTVGSGLARRS